MASVHQKHPVPKVAVSRESGVEVFILLSFFVLAELSFCAQELNPAKLITEMNKTFNMAGNFSFTYAKLTGMVYITPGMQQKFNS